jgi:imidazolonepropionase-like amidohydrolase
VGLPLYPVDGIPVYIKDLPADVLARLHLPKNADEARAAVRGNLANGADGTKLFLHTSPDGTSQRFMSMDVIRAAVDETHTRGKLVLAHPTSLAAIREAITGGVDILVHTTLGEKQPWDAALIEQMKQRNMSVIPTFKLWPYELKKQSVPAPVIDALVAATLEELRAFHTAGGQVLFGTDVGYMHDYDPTDEYVYLQKAGLSPTQILASLTTAPAARWKESDRRGRIVPGADADLVVLAADPADDVRNFANVRCVFRGGRLVFRAVPTPTPSHCSPDAISRRASCPASLPIGGTRKSPLARWLRNCWPATSSTTSATARISWLIARGAAMARRASAAS